MSRFFHRTPDLRLGRGHRHHAGGPARAAHAARLAISADCPHHGQHQRQLSRRRRPDGRELGDQGHRAGHDRRRQPAIHVGDLDLVGTGDDHADLHQRGQSRRRADAGAEQTAARHRAVAPDRAEHRHHRRQGLERLSDGRRLRLHGRADVDHRSRRLCRFDPQRHAEARRRRRLDPALRRRLRDADLARSRQAAEIRADAQRRRHCDPGAERAGLGRPARRIAADAGAAAQRHRYRRQPPPDADAVREHHPQERHRRARSCASTTSRASNWAPRTTPPRHATTALPPRASRSTSRRGPTP